MTIIRAHIDHRPVVDDMTPVFANEVGGPLRCTLFRTRIWRPPLVRAGMLGAVGEVHGGGFEGAVDGRGSVKGAERLRTRTAAVNPTAGQQVGGLRFHDLRHSYATWLVDDGVPPNMVHRVMGHEHATTTLDLYTRRTDNSDRILSALDDPAEDDPDDGAAPAPAPT